MSHTDNQQASAPEASSATQIQAGATCHGVFGTISEKTLLERSDSY
jgi:hypothetical protein